MKHEFGDINLFNLALAADRSRPPIEDYLRSVGLSVSELDEVKSLYEVFCDAIDNAPEAGLPDLASGSSSGTHPGTHSIN